MWFSKKKVLWTNIVLIYSEMRMIIQTIQYDNIVLIYSQIMLLVQVITWEGNPEDLLVNDNWLYQIVTVHMFGQSCNIVEIMIN
jgi:hypothetical protein